MGISGQACSRNTGCYYITVLIGVTFVWTGAAFIIQLYRLFDFLDGTAVSLLTGGLYYVCQAAGIGAAAWLFAKRPAVAGGRALPFAAALVTACCTAAAVFSKSLAVANASGMLMNLAIGVLSGTFLTRLSTDVPQQRRGRVFGCAYAIGSVGTWLLSLPSNGTFLQQPLSLAVVLGLCAVSALMLRRLAPPMQTSGSGRAVGSGYGTKFICLAAATLVLLCVVNTLNFSFPIRSAADSRYLEFTRAFYAVGLIAAGILSDKNRRWGAICCVAALAFPFAAQALGSSMTGETVMWILSYLFFGFFSVYRILVFSDIADRANRPALAVFGLLAGRLGDAAGELGANLLDFKPLIYISAVLFMLVIGLFFWLYQRLYAPVISAEESEQRRFAAYTARFGLSAREQEIFGLILKGMSNAEIAAALYITESTVKFHTGNVFKKTGFASRSELATDFKLGNSG